MMFLFIGSSKQFIELCKLPLLIEHYKKHKIEKGSLSLMDFFKDHYTKETKNDNNDNEDSQLPFKNIINNQPSQLYLPVSEPHIAFKNTNYIRLQNPAYPDWKPFDLIFPVFHPPCIS
jgi:hypothetical protein